MTLVVYAHPAPVANLMAALPAWAESKLFKIYLLWPNPLGLFGSWEVPTWFSTWPVIYLFWLDGLQMYILLNHEIKAFIKILFQEKSLLIVSNI